jgi:O-acetyl-ADP-ribose deacetylase (regulator of RNase III)
LKTVAFPSISTGAFGYPLSLAAPVAVRAVRDYVSGPTTLEEVRFVCYGDDSYAAYCDALGFSLE